MKSTGQRFLIDASTAQIGGGVTYVLNVLPQLARLAPDDRFRVLLRSQDMAGSLSTPSNLEVTLLDPASVASRLRFLLHEGPRLAASWRADLYFSASESAPPRLSCPSIASFRNPNIVDRKGHGWPLPERMRLGLLRQLARLSAQRCERVLFVSEDSARWMGDDLGVPGWKRTVIHHGIDWDAKEVQASPKRHARPHILTVSSIYRYKNFVRLIEAYARFAGRVRDVPDLVIVGDDRDPAYARRMERARRATGVLAGKIHIVGAVPYAEVRSYYDDASLFVFPSYLETFGHPLLEAMASGTPLVAADIPVFREIAGDAALFADPFSSEALADAIEKVLSSEALRRELIDRGGARVREFPWSRSAERHLALFREVAGPRETLPSGNRSAKLD